MGKDLRAVTASRMVVLPLVIVPLLLCVLVPALILVLALRFDAVLITGAQFVEKIIPLYPVPDELPGLTDRILYIFLNYTFLPLFMLVPIMASSVIASDSIVGEKERRTLETLLYTPVTNREFLVAKLLGAFVPAVLISWVGFAGYFLVLNLIYQVARGMLILRSWIWLPTMLLLCPAVSALGLSVTLIVSLRAKTYMEAQQTAGVVVLPFILLIVAQIAGLLAFKPLYVIGLSIIIGLVSLWIVARIAPRFDRETIIATL
jgi:ABC-type transport system involved in multi-copper enzyme maturation permease subunit